LDIRNCSKCEIRKTCKGPVLGEGSNTPTVMYLGEAPGAEEDEQNRPFVGVSGMLLRSAIGGMPQLAKTPFYITNVVRCRPPGNRTPTSEEVNACWEWTEKLIDTLKPKIIVTLGSVALQALSARFGFKLKHESITKLAGYEIFCQEKGLYVFPMVHPAFVLRQRRIMYPVFTTTLSYLERSLPGWIARLSQ